MCCERGSVVDNGYSEIKEVYTYNIIIFLNDAGGPIKLIVQMYNID